MHETSVSVIDDKGMGIPPLVPKDPLKYTSIPNNVTDKPIPFSIPAKHFENFERSIQVNDPMSSMSSDCVITNTMSSSNISQRINLISSACSQLPSLINTNVQDFSDSILHMDVDSDSKVAASRKRALPLSISENQGNIKSKKSASNVNINSRDSLVNLGVKAKTLYSNSDCPPYIIHVYSHSEDPSISPAHPLLFSYC